MPLVEAKSRISLKNILFPTDFSERSAVALPYAAAIARRYSSKIYLVHIVPPEGPVAVLPEGPPVSDYRIAEQEMSILDRSDLLSNVRFETLLEQGEIWDVLTEIIAKYKVDLIVLATHGRGGFKKLVLGSVAEDIVREAPCPVLTIGPEVPVQAELKRNLQQIVFATDFRPGSLAALMYAVFFAEENRARLTLLHVVDPAVEYGDEEHEKALQRLQRMLPAENYLLWEPKFLVKSGPAADTVLKAAREEKADLLVIGAREVKHHWMSRHFAWTTLYQILCDAPCPILSVRG